MVSLEDKFKGNYEFQRSIVYTRVNKLVYELFRPTVETERLFQELMIVKSETHPREYDIYSSNNGQILPLENYQCLRKASIGLVGNIAQEIITLTEPRPQEIRLVRIPDTKLYSIYIKEF